MTEQNPMEVFKEEAPEVAQAFDGLIQSLVQTKGLDPKTKELIT
jgi:alkylhydroperoxidase/carboxymuconolactone decarboxylase family protein YurZ